jgi:hypothetical protein
MKKRIKNRILALIILAILPIYGCAGVIIGGAAAGTGVYTYVKGEVKRNYYKKFDQCVAASNHVLKGLNVRMLEPIRETARIILKAERTNKSVITVAITKQKLNLTEISVRSGVVGMWDKQLSELIHDSIAEKLQ